MPPRRPRKQLTTYIDCELAERFETVARSSDGSTAAAIARLIHQATEGDAPVTVRGVGTGVQVGIRLKPEERVSLATAARSRGTTPANWLRSLALVHLARRPQWNGEEVDALRELARQLQPIGNNLNQIARALNAGAVSGAQPSGQGEVAREAAEIVRYELRRLAAVVTGNFDYWGLPDAERPSAARGAVQRAEAAHHVATERKRLMPRRRPARFVE